MMNKPNKSLFLTAVMLIVFAAATRLFPHYPNFTAIGAMAIFGGAVISDKRLAVILPLIALLLSDVLLGMFTATPAFYGTSQYFVYGAFLLVALLSTLMKNRSAANIAFAAIWSGLIFFAISNLGVWLNTPAYPKSPAGLAACYWAALPFYKNEFFGNFLLNSIYGNLFFSALLFGAYAVVARGKQQRVIA